MERPSMCLRDLDEKKTPKNCTKDLNEPDYYEGWSVTQSQTFWSVKSSGP